MNKIKTFFALTALLLVTVGVFAGKSKFFDSYTVYFEYNPGTGIVYVPFTSSLPSNTTISPTGSASQFTATSIGGFSGAVWYYDVSNPGTVAQKAVCPNK